jgi:hypothetical protein
MDVVIAQRCREFWAEAIRVSQSGGRDCLRKAVTKLDIIGNKREDLSFQRKLESRTKHPFEKLDSCLRRTDKQFISNSRYLGFG